MVEGKHVDEAGVVGDGVVEVRGVLGEGGEVVVREVEKVVRLREVLDAVSLNESIASDQKEGISGQGEVAGELGCAEDREIEV